MIIHTLYGECAICGRKDLVVVQHQEAETSKPVGAKFLAPHYDRATIVNGNICKGTFEKGALNALPVLQPLP